MTHRASWRSAPQEISNISGHGIVAAALAAVSQRNTKEIFNLSFIFMSDLDGELHWGYVSPRIAKDLRYYIVSRIFVWRIFVLRSFVLRSFVLCTFVLCSFVLCCFALLCFVLYYFALHYFVSASFINELE